MSNKLKKVCMSLNYIEHFLILIYVVTGGISIPASASLLDVLIGIPSSEICIKFVQ